MTDPTVIDKLAKLARAFPRQDMGPEVLETYAEYLGDLPPAAVCAAIDRAIQTATFPPSIGELRKAVADLALGDAALPEAVWAEVEREIRRVGHNRPPLFRNGRFEPAPAPEFSDPLIAEAVAATGWAYLCTGEPESVVKAQFTKTLSAIRQRAAVRVQTGRAPDGRPLGDAISGNEIPALAGRNGRGEPPEEA